MNETLFHKLGDILDELDVIMPQFGEYKSDVKSAYNDLDNLYEALKETYGYKDNRDEE